MEETYETVYGNIYISVYNKRKHRDYNEDNILCRTAVSPIPCHGRATGGVIVMRLSEDAKVVTFSTAPRWR